MVISASYEGVFGETIPGKAFDFSARDPPPQCHPGTRLAILEQYIHVVVNCSDEKMRWLFGVAGVRKSAMQNIAVSLTLRASIFFLVNGRSNATKTIVTLAYQLAAKCEPYRQFIEYEVRALLQSSTSVQFNKFVLEPFIHHPRLNSDGRVLIIIDGLYECDQIRPSAAQF
jgi:hypothetical protein